MTEIPQSADATPGRVRAVLFDLDDTLFDHRHCMQASLEAVWRGHECFRASPFAELERAHGALLEELHRDVMLGRVDVDSARVERFRRLFRSAGVEASDALARDTASKYRRAYVSARRAVAGAAPLLASVRERAAVVVVSNNVLEEQQEKLRDCGLDAFVDALVVSEEEGVSKPDPEIFRRALERVGCASAEAVMLGDSWAADVAGARAAGIRAVWFNRHGDPKPEASDDVLEIRSLEPPGPVLEAIFSRHARAERRVGRVGEAHADRR